MNAISFDTLRYVKRLQSGGFTPEQAEAQAEALALAIGDSLATSDELKITETALETRIDRAEAALEARIDKTEAALRKDINDLRLEIRAEIREANLGLIKWIVPMLIGQTAIVAALVKLF